MGKTYEHVDQIYCKKAADYLSSAFSFSYSPEGGDFWNAVHKRLYDLGNGKLFTEALKLPNQELVHKENVRLAARLTTLQEEVNSQAQTIVELKRKLLIADFCNMGR